MDKASIVFLGFCAVSLAGGGTLFASVVYDWPDFILVGSAIIMIVAAVIAVFRYVVSLFCPSDQNPEGQKIQL